MQSDNNCKIPVKIGINENMATVIVGPALNQAVVPAVAVDVQDLTNNIPDNKITNGAHCLLRHGTHTVMLVRKQPTNMHSVVTNVLTDNDHGKGVDKHMALKGVIRIHNQH